MRTIRSDGRRVRRTREERERLVQEQTQSGESRAEFCRKRGIKLGTFYTWQKSGRRSALTPRFAEVELPRLHNLTAVEVLLGNGARVGIRHGGSQQELISLVRGVAGC
jgi:transposase-like protein